MKRLLKESIGDIKREDINIKLNEQRSGSMDVFLKNKEKAKELKPWIYMQDDPIEMGNNEYSLFIGGIDFYIEESTISIYLLEINKAYEDSSVALYLLREFEKIILDPLINKYGKNEVGIITSFENMKLKATIEKICKRKNINIIDKHTTYNTELEKDNLYNLHDISETVIDNYETSGNKKITLIDNNDEMYIYTNSSIPDEVLINKSYVYIKMDNGDLFFSDLDELDIRSNYDTISNIYVSKNGYITSLDKTQFDNMKYLSDSGKYEKVANIKRLKIRG